MVALHNTASIRIDGPQHKDENKINVNNKSQSEMVYRYVSK